MVQNINKLKGKITENGYSIDTFSSQLGLCDVTVRKKMSKEKSDFSISESLKVKEILKLSTKDYLDIFFGEELEFNSK
jgi:hypothetical protein